jgi:hypothetical protein
MLFLGYLPHEFFSLSTLPATVILFTLTLLAAACMVLSLWVYRKAIHNNNEHNTQGGTS